MDFKSSLGQHRPDLASLWYSVAQEELYHCDLGNYRTYGIRVSGYGPTYILHDVSVCKSTVDRIVELSNFHGLSPLHLYDVASDMIS